MVLSCGARCIAQRAFKINEMQMRANEQRLIGKCQNMFKIFTFRSIWQTLSGLRWTGGLVRRSCCWLGQLSPDKLAFAAL